VVKKIENHYSPSPRGQVNHIHILQEAFGWRCYQNGSTCQACSPPPREVHIKFAGVLKSEFEEFAPLCDWLPNEIR
jgi:hypothetical protein